MVTRFEEMSSVGDPDGAGCGWEGLLVEQVRRHGRLLFRLAFGVLRDVSAAEDACQQAILTAWEQREEIRDPAALRGWLARVVVNESLRMRRRQSGERRALREWNVRQEAATDNRSRSRDPTDRGERPELHETLHTALAELPEKTQAVVVLRLMQGMPGEEVKGLLGCSSSEVSRRLHQGMAMLRQLHPVQMARAGLVPS